MASHYAEDMEVNTATVTCLRSVLMKPEHGEWLDQIMGILERAASRSTTA